MAERSSTRWRRRLWRFADAEFDEASWSLRVKGQAVPLEAKPLEVLHELLLRAGEVVTKEELLDSVWAGVSVVEGSLPTAISKLRKALGARSGIIDTVPRIGYRLACSVTVESVDAPLKAQFDFSPGDQAPGRPQWRLEAPLGDSGAADVWLAKHLKTGEPRVFKFADTPDRLRALKREAALGRLVAASLGKAAPMPALLEWNFDQSPYFLEYAYGGPDLIAWARSAGGLTAVPLHERIMLAAKIASAVAALHGLGVLHKDLKPANILIDTHEDGGTIKLVDLGSGRLLDHGLLDRFQITNPGSLEAALVADDARSGTAAYRAPELVGDTPPTAKSDIYALGLILYQLVVGDFSRALAPGWESQVPDPLLREDIRRAAEGDPTERMASAEDLANRLGRLEERRQKAEKDAEQAAFLAAQRRLEERRAARRPWVRAAAASLVLGLFATSSLAGYAWWQKNEAEAAQRLAQTGYSFIAEDVLASPDPSQSSADETVINAIKRAQAAIDSRFGGSPEVAARLHLAVARAFYQRADIDTARAGFIRADRLFTEAGEADSDEAARGRLNRIHMEAVSGQPNRLEEAGRLLASERARLGARGESGELGYLLAMAEGAHGYMADIEASERAFRRAVEIGERPGSGVAPHLLLKAKSSHLLTLMRLGRPDEAEPLARTLVADTQRVRGENHADTLMARQHWLHSLSMQGRHEDVLRGSGPLLTAMQQRLGPAHRLTLALHSTRFQSLDSLGRYAEAAREAEQVWRGASASSGPDSHQALVGQVDTAWALCRTPERSRGLALAADAAARSQRAFGAHYPLTHTVRYYAAECYLTAQRWNEADALLAGIDRVKVGQLIGDADWGGQLDLARAEVAQLRGDRTTARTLLGQADAALAGTADPALVQRLRTLSRAVGA